MGNKLSCSCAPLIRKAYRYEDSPWQAGARGGMGGSGARRGDTGHLLRCGSLRERKRCAYHTIQPFNHSIRLHYQSLLFWEGYLLLSCNTLTPPPPSRYVGIRALYTHTYTYTYTYVYIHVSYTCTTIFIFSGRTCSLQLFSFSLVIIIIIIIKKIEFHFHKVFSFQ